MLTQAEQNIKGVSSILSSLQAASLIERDDNVYAPEKFLLLEDILFNAIKDLEKIKEGVKC